MLFTKQYRFNEPFWFSGIYKITEYKFYNGYDSPPYYHAYLIQPDSKNWGDYVGGRSAQHMKQLSFDECVALCEDHAKDYAPLPKQIRQAAIAQQAWMD